MINSGLPYSSDDMEKIYKDGVIVDMSNIAFPGIQEENNARTSIIYLRNTGYKTELDFSKCDYEFKKKILKEYYLGDILYNIKELSSTLLDTMLVMRGIKLHVSSIFTTEETVRFIEEERKFLEGIYYLIDSLPLYIYSRLMNEKGESAFDINSYISSSHIPCNKNIIYILDFNEINEIALGNNPVFFKNIFTVEETELFEACKNLTFYNTLESLLELSNEEALDLMNKVDTYYEQISK